MHLVTLLAALFVALFLGGCSGASDAAVPPPGVVPAAAPLAVPAASPPAPPPPPPPRFRDLAVGFAAVCGVLEGGGVQCSGQGASYSVDAHGPARAVVFGHQMRVTSIFVLREDGVVMQGSLAGSGTTLTALDALAGASAISPWAEGVCALVGGAPRCWSPWDASGVSEPRLPGPAGSLFGDSSSGCRFAWGRLDCDAGRAVTTCAQLEDERVFCWSKQRASAREATALSGARSLAILGSNLSWLDRDGAAFQQPVGSRARPSAIRSPVGVALAVGYSASACFVDAQGEVACSGGLVPGAAADGVPSAELVSVRDVHHATAIVHAFDTTCALAGGEAWCWGSNQRGRLGVPAPDSLHPSAPIAGIDDAVALFVTSATACVRRRAGGLSCWGAPLAGFGEAPWTLPALHAIAGVEAVSGETSSGVLLTSPGGVRGFGQLSPRYYTHTEAAPVVMEDEDSHTWTVGDVVEDATPMDIPGIAGRVVELAASRNLACARTADGALHCFHRGEERRDGALVPALSSVTRVIDAGVSRVAALGDGICAQATTGMRCFGVIREVNANGPSMGTILVRAEPWPFEASADAWAGSGGWACGLRGTDVQCRHEGREDQGLAGVTALAVGPGEIGVGSSTLCGITTERRVICTPLGARVSRPAPVDGLTNVVELGLGGGFGCARHADGRVSCWGLNGSGVLPRDGERDRISAPERLGG